jgi:hypothetical protein
MAIPFPRQVFLYDPPMTIFYCDDWEQESLVMYLKPSTSTKSGIWEKKKIKWILAPLSFSRYFFLGTV